MSDQQESFRAASPADPQQRQRRLSPAHVGSVPEISTVAAAAAAADGTAPAEPAPAPAPAPASAPAPAPAPAPADEPQSPPFEPLFTLLTNTTTNATVHPRVHYLFSDDDTSVLAAPQDSPSHRTLLVDLAAPSPSDPHAAWSVSWAASLSPDFAITGSRLSAQQPDNGDGDGGGPAGSLMLRVEGVEREPVDAQAQAQAQDMAISSSAHEDTEALADDFHRRMGVLKRVVNEGEKRRQWLQAKAEQEQHGETEEQEEHHEGNEDDQGNLDGKTAEDGDGREASGSAATPAIATEVVDV